MKLEDLYHELILDYGTAPRNHCALKNASFCAEGFKSRLCGEKVKLYLKRYIPCKVRSKKRLLKGYRAVRFPRLPFLADGNVLGKNLE